MRKRMPPEAPAIAARFRNAAGRLREMAGEIRSIRSHLESTWEGNSQQNYIMDFGNFPDHLDGIANELEGYASTVLNMRVDDPDSEF